jgi:protein arginine N-methyltransferase 1
MHQYPLSVFGKLIGDKVRTGAYYEALRRSITPDSVVLDIGTGSGIFACIACELGARKVYALEPSSMIQLGRAVASANGYGDRVEFIQGLSTAITLPEPVDVVVSDLRGIIPLFEQHVPSIIDARTRLMRPGGQLIPQTDAIWVSVVETQRLYDRQAKPWQDRPYGVDMNVVKRFTTNAWINGRVRQEDLLTDATRWAVLDYRTITQPDVQGRLEWTVKRSGTAHGLCLWFDTTLIEGVGYSTGPFADPAPALIYGHAFFPFSDPAAVSAGDTITVDLDARLRADDYMWQWSTSIQRATSPAENVSLRQSTFFCAPWSSSALRKRTPGYVPTVSMDGQIDAYILRLMDGKASIEQIARCVASRFSDRIKSFDRAFARVSEVAERYS